MNRYFQRARFVLIGQRTMTYIPNSNANASVYQDTSNLYWLVGGREREEGVAKEGRGERTGP